MFTPEGPNGASVDRGPAENPIPTLEQRQCGRCRGWFPWDRLDSPNAAAGWWLCDSCRIQLLQPFRPTPATR
jgi:hypothetical protein